MQVPRPRATLTLCLSLATAGFVAPLIAGPALAAPPCSALGGKDVVSGLTSADVVCGGAGDDRLEGGLGCDHLRQGRGTGPVTRD